MAAGDWPADVVARRWAVVVRRRHGHSGRPEGLYLKLRAEHRYGETIVGNVGCFISPTLIADLPVYNSEEVYLTNVLLT